MRWYGSFKSIVLLSTCGGALGRGGAGVTAIDTVLRLWPRMLYPAGGGPSCFVNHRCNGVSALHLSRTLPAQWLGHQPEPRIRAHCPEKSSLLWS